MVHYQDTHGAVILLGRFSDEALDRPLIADICLERYSARKISQLANATVVVRRHSRSKMEECLYSLQADAASSACDQDVNILQAEV